MTKIKGMDISYVQGRVSVANFKKAKAAGIKYVILRLGYTGYEKYICKLDAVFENNYKNAKAAGLPIGIYYYSLANGPITGKEEAEFTVKHLKGKKIDYPVYLDVEDPRFRQSKASKQNLADACNAWCKVIAAAGYTPGIYASTSWFNNKIGTIKEKHTKWVAQYYKRCEYKGDYDMWQYSSTEGVPGISSKTDVNWCYKNFLGDKKPEEPKEDKNYKLVSYDGTFPKIPVRGYFKRGDDSKQVKNLQLFLNWYGNYNLVVDSVVGSKTIWAVEKFQKSQGINVDGLFGKKCLQKAKAYKKKVKIEEPKKDDPPDKTPEKEPVIVDKKGYQGKFPSLTFTKTKQQVIDDAVDWAIMISKDNRFHYGYTNKKVNPWHPNAHHNGCYFCGTQGKNKNGILDKEFTYCCNPFIHAAWAHGGQVPYMLKVCKKGDSYDFHKNTGYDKSEKFKNLGHPKQSELKKGDVLCRDSHVAMYVGNGKIVEASGGDDNVRNSKKWNNSIAVKSLSKFNYSNFPRVHRYNEKEIQISKSLEYGDLNNEIKKLQKFLNWYGDYNLTVDGFFMDKTLKAVKKFQTKENLKSDGIVGQKTIDKMKTIKK